MVTEVLYSQPNDEKPYLLLNELKKGKYEPCSSMELRSYIRFTEIGEACWRTSLEIEPASKIICKSYSHIDDTWEVEISYNGLIIIISTTRYKMSKIFIRLKLEGEEKRIEEFVTKLISRLGSVPTEMHDYKKFTDVTGITQAEVLKAWQKYITKDNQDKNIFILHVQPSTDSPYLILADLKKGKYTTCGPFELKSYIKFTDIGEKFYLAAKKVDENAQIQCTNYSHIDETWTVSINFLNSRISMKSSKYKQLGKFYATAYILIEITGKKVEIADFADALSKHFPEPPLKFNDNNKFEEKSGISVSKTLTNWNDLISLINEKKSGTAVIEEKIKKTTKETEQPTEVTNPPIASEQPTEVTNPPVASEQPTEISKEIEITQNTVTTVSIEKTPSLDDAKTEPKPKQNLEEEQKTQAEPQRDERTATIEEYVSNLSISQEEASKLYDAGYKNYDALKKGSIVRLAMAGIDPSVAMKILDKVKKR